MQRIIVTSAIAVGALIVLILGYGIVTELIKAGRPVARVGDAEITTREYQKRQQYERRLIRLQVNFYQQELAKIDPNAEEQQDAYQQLQLTVTNLQKQLDPDLATILGGRVIDDMIEEELVRQEANARGIGVTSAEVQQHNEQLMGYGQETQTVTETAISDFDEAYQLFRENALKASRFSEQSYRELVRTDLLRERLKEQLGEDVQTVAEQVQTTFYIAETEEEGQALRVRLNEQEITPEDLRQELNSDESESSGAYELPWLPLGQLASQTSQEIERAAFNTPVGRASEPILGPDGQYYVIYVNGHEERELDDYMLQSAEDQAYAAWLETQKAARAEYLDWEDAVITQ